MKACVLRQPAPIESNPLEYTHLAKPAPTGNQVLVRVNACGICRTDLHVIEGELPRRKSPIVPGHQVVGVIEAIGERAQQHAIGTRVGIAWLHSTDGTCEYCRANKENLCDNPTFTGWTVDGGYAEYALAEESFVYPIPEGFDDLKAAPLLCAGIIGFRALRLSGIERGGRLGLYGFGAAAGARRFTPRRATSGIRSSRWSWARCGRVEPSRSRRRSWIARSFSRPRAKSCRLR